MNTADVVVLVALAGACGFCLMGSLVCLQMCIKLYTEFVKEKKYRQM
jgi:Fe-S cluster biogenesis protein NfuA